MLCKNKLKHAANRFRSVSTASHDVRSASSSRIIACSATVNVLGCQLAGNTVYIVLLYGSLHVTVDGVGPRRGGTSGQHAMRQLRYSYLSWPVAQADTCMLVLSISFKTLLTAFLAARGVP